MSFCLKKKKTSNLKFVLLTFSTPSIISNAASIKGKVARNALLSEEGVRSAHLSKQLVTLDCEIPKKSLFHDFEELAFIKPMDEGKALMDLFDKYDFKTLVPRVENLWKEIDQS